MKELKRSASRLIRRCSSVVPLRAWPTRKTGRLDVHGVQAREEDPVEEEADGVEARDERHEDEQPHEHAPPAGRVRLAPREPQHARPLLKSKWKSIGRLGYPSARPSRFSAERAAQ